MNSIQSVWGCWARRVGSVIALAAVTSLVACDRGDPDVKETAPDTRTSKRVPATQSNETSRQTEPTAAPESPALDVQQLVGLWIRTDTPYAIEIRAARDDGTLDAAYYNPSPINVARAEARVKKPGLEVFVELRDVNYPGSTYTLAYDRATDMLHGVYFQATAREYYDVAFARQR